MDNETIRKVCEQIYGIKQKAERDSTIPSNTTARNSKSGAFFGLPTHEKPHLSQDSTIPSNTTARNSTDAFFGLPSHGKPHHSQDSTIPSNTTARNSKSGAFFGLPTHEKPHLSQDSTIPSNTTARNSKSGAFFGLPSHEKPHLSQGFKATGRSSKVSVPCRRIPHEKPFMYHGQGKSFDWTRLSEDSAIESDVQPTNHTQSKDACSQTNYKSASYGKSFDWTRLSEDSAIESDVQPTNHTQSKDACSQTNYKSASYANRQSDCNKSSVSDLIQIANSSTSTAFYPEGDPKLEGIRTYYPMQFKNCSSIGKIDLHQAPNESSSDHHNEHIYMEPISKPPVSHSVQDFTAWKLMEYPARSPLPTLSLSVSSSMHSLTTEETPTSLQTNLSFLDEAVRYENPIKHLWETEQCKHKKDTIAETLWIAKQIQKRNFKATDMDIVQNIKTIINSNAEDYFRKHSNLMAISACPIISFQKKGMHGKRWCIVFYCRLKGQIPIGETRFPERIEKYPVDIREGWFMECAKTNNDLYESSKYLPHLCSGAQVQVQNGRVGTLGGFVRLNDCSIGCLTCGHVCMPEEFDATNFKTELQGIGQPKVYQPLCSEGSKHIGHVDQISFSHGERFKVSTDAALIVLTDTQRHPKDGYFIKANEEDLAIAGFRSADPPNYSSGEIKDPVICQVVHKYGCVTGLTTGVLVFDGMVVRRENIQMKMYENDVNRVLMFNQLEIYPLHNHDFFRLGDSGSLVFQKDCSSSRLVAVGLAIGVTSYGAGLATPIGAVLEKFKLQKSLLSFPTAEPYMVSDLTLQYSNNTRRCGRTSMSSSNGNTELPEDGRSPGTSKTFGYAPSSGYLSQSSQRYSCPLENTVDSSLDVIHDNTQGAECNMEATFSNNMSFRNNNQSQGAGIIGPKGAILSVNVFRPTDNSGDNEFDNFTVQNVALRLPAKSKIVVETTEGTKINFI